MNRNFPTSLWCCIYKKELLMSERLREDIHHLEDLEYQFRILNKVDRVYICEEPIYNYVQRNGSANSSGITEKLLSCLLVSDTVNKAVANDPKLKHEYISQTKFRLAMTICAKYLMCNYQNPELEQIFIDTAKQTFSDVLKGNDVKIKIQCFAIKTNFKAYALLYRKLHKL